MHLSGFFFVRSNGSNDFGSYPGCFLHIREVVIFLYFTGIFVNIRDAVIVDVVQLFALVHFVASKDFKFDPRLVLWKT